MRIPCPTCGHVGSPGLDSPAALAWLREHPGKTTHEIARGLRVSPRHVVRWTTDGAAAGTLYSSGAGTRGDPRLWFVA